MPLVEVRERVYKAGKRAIHMSFWPTPQDYNEAIQTPARNLADLELQQGRPEVNALGLPRPTSGAFASVYRIKNRGKDWAVKCFLHGYDDQQERSQIISEFIRETPTPYTVNFQYQRNGILVRGEWFPIVKMEWIDGQTLLDYIEEHHKRVYKLERLAEEFREMMQTLRNHGIAHGDLQHGNILVGRDGRLKLVDYDGMFVPSLAGRQSAELGHRNYQHPGRSKEVFSSNLDNFSAWIIYASVRILARDASIWDQIYHDGESLLFRNSDYLKPERSALLHYLEQYDCPVVRGLARQVHANCLVNVEDVCAPGDGAPHAVELPANKERELDFVMPSGEHVTLPVPFDTRSGAESGPSRMVLSNRGMTLIDTKVPYLKLVPDLTQDVENPGSACSAATPGQTPVSQTMTSAQMVSPAWSHPWWQTHLSNSGTVPAPQPVRPPYSPPHGQSSSTARLNARTQSVAARSSGMPKAIMATLGTLLLVSAGSMIHERATSRHEANSMWRADVERTLEARNAGHVSANITGADKDFAYWFASGKKAETKTSSALALYDYSRAVEAANRSVSDSADVGRSYLAIGNIFNELGDLKSGEAALLEALRLLKQDPQDHAETLYAYGQNTALAKNYTESIALLEQALASFNDIDNENGHAWALKTSQKISEVQMLQEEEAQSSNEKHEPVSPLLRSLHKKAGK